MGDAIRPDGYRLGRSYAESNRLNSQQFIWKAVCGYNIHATILATSNQKLKVADIGTGTGIWMIDVSSDHHDYELDGFDISLSQCPPENLWPKNCAFYEWDMQKDIPERFHGIYDIVHARLVMGGLKDDPSLALRNFLKMLKPGGHLQWQEVNFSTLGVAAASPDLKRSAVTKLVDTIHASFKFGVWVPRLSEICSREGFVDCQRYSHHLQPHLAVPFVQTQLGAYEEISKGAFDNSTPDSPGPQLRNAIREASEELLTGVWVDHKLEVVVARKPL